MVFGASDVKCIRIMVFFLIVTSPLQLCDRSPSVSHEHITASFSAYVVLHSRSVHASLSFKFRALVLDAENQHLCFTDSDDSYEDVRRQNQLRGHYFSVEYVLKLKSTSYYVGG